MQIPNHNHKHPFYADESSPITNIFPLIDNIFILIMLMYRKMKGIIVFSAVVQYHESEPKNSKSPWLGCLR